MYQRIPSRAPIQFLDGNAGLRVDCASSHNAKDQCHGHQRIKRWWRTIPLGVILSATAVAFGQSSPAAKDRAKLPSFEVATIKPADPNRGGDVGFVGRPGGRVHFGFSRIETLIYYAFNVPSNRIVGIPASIAKSEFEIVAIPPADSKSRAGMGPSIQATPTEEQREMLQSLLIDRFGLKYHYETKDGPVYLLLKGSGQLQLQPAKDKTLDARGAIVQKGGGIVDGEAFGTNITMGLLAAQLTRNMGRPVLDRTGLDGTYDFQLEPDDPENTDLVVGTIDAMHRLGLELKPGKGPIRTIVVDSVHAPTEN
jgi:uncharacterized protein (TIGR03435 family)